MSMDFKMGGGTYYESPEVSVLEFMARSGILDASPNGALQNLIVNDLINDEGV